MNHIAQETTEALKKAQQITDKMEAKKAEATTFNPNDYEDELPNGPKIELLDGSCLFDRLKEIMEKRKGLIPNVRARFQKTTKGLIMLAIGTHYECQELKQKTSPPPPTFDPKKHFFHCKKSLAEPKDTSSCFQGLKLKFNSTSDLNDFRKKVKDSLKTPFTFTVDIEIISENLKGKTGTFKLFHLCYIHYHITRLLEILDLRQKWNLAKLTKMSSFIERYFHDTSIA